MKAKIDCPMGRYDSEMRIICKADGRPCGFQYYKACKGWWALTDRAAGCTRRAVYGRADNGETGKGY